MARPIDTRVVTAKKLARTVRPMANGVGPPRSLALEGGLSESLGRMWDNGYSLGVWTTLLDSWRVRI